MCVFNVVYSVYYFLVFEIECDLLTLNILSVLLSEWKSRKEKEGGIPGFMK